MAGFFYPLPVNLRRAIGVMAYVGLLVFKLVFTLKFTGLFTPATFVLIYVVHVTPPQRYDTLVARLRYL